MCIQAALRRKDNVYPQTAWNIPIDHAHSWCEKDKVSMATKRAHDLIANVRPLKLAWSRKSSSRGVGSHTTSTSDPKLISPTSTGRSYA